ncbi:MAG TPA: metallophosphoesterase [Blastocatellia bacterium]|nr:metallophosphoesterase [Blastocatellia bacterium]
MDNKKSSLVSRRQALKSLAAITAGTLIKPTSLFATNVNSKTRFAVMGDFGTGGDDEVSIARKMAELHRDAPFDFVLGAGDNIYPNGAGHLFVRNFEQPFANLLREDVKLYTVLGNHDVEAGRRDQMHYPLFNMGEANYYMFGRGNGLVDFFMLDSTDFDNQQTTWLENKLAQSKALWKIAVFHHPIYSSGKKHGSDTRLRQRLEPLLKKHNVQVVFSGHDHVYERLKPQDGIQYFVSGGAGKVRRGDIRADSSISAASYDDDNHFMVIELEEKQIAFKAISKAGAVVDSGFIRQSESRS